MPSSTGLPTPSLTVPSAKPKNSENTTICRISLCAIASAKLFGNMWAMKSRRFSAPVFRFEVASAAGSARFMPWPGCSALAITRPSSSEVIEAAINHIIAFRPMRPTARPSPMLAMPATSVANTSGPMIILIIRRNTSVRMDRWSAIDFAVAASGAMLCTAVPTSTPSSIAMKIRVGSRFSFIVDQACASVPGEC
ncbi:hypothetical protein D3C72_1301390 [compost metagenome]